MPKKLTEQDRIKLDGIVQQMVSNGETDDDIKFVVEDFKGKYGVDEVLDTPSPEVKKKEVTIPTTPLQPKTEYPLASGLSSGSIPQSPTQSIPTVQSSGQPQRNPNWYDKYIPEEYRTPEVLAKVKNIARTSSPSEALNKINQLKGDIDVSTGKIKTKNVDKVISDNEKLIVNKNYDFNEQVNQNYDQLSTQVKEGNIQNGYNGITAEQNTEIKKLSYEGALQSEAGQRRQSVFDAETQIEQQVSNDIDRFGKFIQKTTIAPNVKEWLLENKNTAKDLVVSPTSHPTFLKEYTKIYKTDIERQREIELDKLSKSTPFSEQYSELDQSIRPEYQAKINEINNKYNEFISKYQTKLSPLAKLKASTIVLQEGLANKKMPDVSKIGSMVLESLGVPEYEKAERLKSEGVGLTPDQKIATEKVGNEALKDFVSVYKPSADEGNPASKKLVAVANHLIKTNDEILKDNPEFVNKQVSEAISNEIANNPKEYYGVTINGIPTAGVQQTFGLYDINDEMIAKAGKKLGIPQEYYSRITDKDIKSGNILGSFTSGAIGETALGIGGLSERLSNLSKGYSLETSNELANRWEDKAGFWKGLYNPASASNIQEDATIVDLDKTSDTYLQNIKNPNAGSWNLNLSTVLDKMFYGGGMILGLGKGGSSMGKLMQSARLLNTEAGLINKSEKALELGYKAESAIDRAKYGTEATELLAKSGKASELADQLGMFTYGYMSGFDRNYRTGLTQFEGQPNADKKALVYAGMYSFIENAVEQMGFSEVKFVRGLSKTGTQRMTDLVERITSEGINSFDKKTLKENLTSVIKSGIKVGGDITAEVAEEISTNIGDIMIKMLTGANKDPNADFLKDQWNTAVHTVIQMALTTGLGEIRQKSPMRENVQYQVALQPEAVRQAIKEQEIAGKINTATAIERMKTVNTLVELNNEIPQQDPISGKVLSTKEKIQYLNEGLKERLANHALEKTTDEVQKKRYEQIIKEAQEVKIKILETPTLEEETPQGIGVVEVDGKFTVNNPNGTEETFDTRELADARVVELSNPQNISNNATQNPQTTSTESTATIGQNELPQKETTITEDVTTTEIEQPKPISAKLDGKDVTIEKTESGYTYTRPNGFEIEVTEDEHLQNISDNSLKIDESKAGVSSKDDVKALTTTDTPTAETATNKAKKADIERRRQENPSVERGVLINYESGKTKEQLIDIVNKLKNGEINLNEIIKEFFNLPINTLSEVKEAFKEGTLADKIQFGLDTNELSDLQPKTRSRESIINAKQKALFQKQKTEEALKDSEYKTVKKTDPITGKVTETKVKRTAEEKTKYDDFHKKALEDVNKEIEKYDAELKELENNNPTLPTNETEQTTVAGEQSVSTDVEAKKADIERRKQEELEKPYKTVNDGSGKMVTVTTETTENEGVKKTKFKTETTNSKGEPRTQNDKGYNNFEEAVENLQIDVENDYNKSGLELVSALKENAKGRTSVRVVEIRESTDKSSPFYGSRTATVIVNGEAIEFRLKNDAELTALQPTTISDKKADIERRRQEKLDRALSDVNELRQADTVYKAQVAIVKATQESSLPKAVDTAGMIIGESVSAKASTDIISVAKRLSDAIEKIQKPQVDKINAEYDAEYIDAVKKGKMTKEQAMKALEEVGRKDSKAYAELATLEETSGVSGSALKDVEGKKAYIERRRQEELETTDLYQYDKNFKEFQTYGSTVKEAFDNLFEQVKNNPTDKKLSDLLDYINERLVPEDIRQGSDKNPLVQEYIDGNQQNIEKASKSTKSTISKINAKYDAEYIDAVKKGKMTKEQAMKALEEVGRKDSKAYAELATLEETSGVSGSALKDVEEDSEKWYKAKKTIKDKDGNDIKLTIDKNKDDKHFYIKATDSNGKEVGSALFETSDGEVWSGNEIEVNEANRRKGIMSAMYDFAESEGHPLEPTKTLSKEGKAFWDNRKAPTQYTEAATPKKEVVPTTKESEMAASEKVGFTEAKDLNKIYADLKTKYGDKKGSALYEVANRLVNPNENTIVEIRSNGVVVKEGDKYILKPFGNTDANMKKWTLYKGLDVTEQFAKPTKESSVDVSDNPALKDVESTAKALWGVQKENADKFVNDFANIDIPFRQKNIQAEMDSEVKKQLFPNEKSRRKYAETIYSAVVRSGNFPKILSEAYHKAKKDGSNPELVKAVEEALSKPNTNVTTPTKEVSTSENKIKSWIDKWEELKKENDNEQLDLFYNKVKVALNGYAQGKGVVDEFTKLKSEIEQFAKERKAKTKEQGNKERVSSNSNEGNSALRDVESTANLLLNHIGKNNKGETMDATIVSTLTNSYSLGAERYNTLINLPLNKDHNNKISIIYNDAKLTDEEKEIAYDEVSDMSDKETAKYISEQYHADKKSGIETNLTKAVESALATNTVSKDELKDEVTEEQKMQFGKGYKDYDFAKADIPTNKIKITEQPSLSERKELVDDIKENGIKEPIIAEYDSDSDTYLVKNGNNRAQIAKDLGIKTIPTIVATYKESVLTTNTPTEKPTASKDELKDVKPKKLFHSSVSGIENIRDGAVISELGIHFGTKETAETLNEAKGGTVREYDVDIKNPIEVHDFARWEAFAVSRKLLQMGILTEAEHKKINKQTGNDKERELLKVLKSKGYDGFVYDNFYEGGGKSYVAFDKSQVKPTTTALATNTVEGKAETPKSQTKNTENEKQQPNEGNIDQDGNIRSEPKNQGELAKIENEIARIEENIAEREREEGITTGKVAVADIIVQPKTFQFKATDETESGVNKTEKLQGTYDRNVGGTISVWKDTKNELGNGANKIYVVDGHHRLDLAKRSGTKDLDVFFIEAETAKDARLAGARANIAQGRGTSIDSAKIFRESPDKMGSLKPNSKVGKEGEALSKLNDNVFELVATGKLPIKVGIALSQVDQKYQTEIAPIVNKFANNPIATQDKLNRYARKLQEEIQAGNAEVKEIQTLFGTETQVDIQNSAIVESEIINAIKNDARLFSSVKNNKEVLENANNQIDVETATEESEKAKKSAGLFDTFRTRKSVSDIYNKAVADYKNAKTSKQKSDIISKASTQVKDAIQKELDSTFGTPQKSTSKPKKSISKEAFTALTNMLQKAFPKVKFIDEARAKEILEKFGFDNISKMFIGNKNANLFSESFNGKTIGENFNFANELEAQGKSSDEIKFATGWFKAGDGKWRYEITDNEAKLKDKLPNKGEEVTTKLKYILDHPKLLELYPQLENTEITITNDNTNSSHGLHYKLGNKHYIVVNTTGDINQTISEILHEVQHAVQLESGLSVGANNNTIYQRKLEVFKDKFGRSPSADESRTLAIEANREYQSTYGEIEAKATQDNAKQSEQQRVFDSTIEKTINKYGINKDDITYRSLNDIQYLETPDGTVFGFQKGDEIFLDPELMNADTPIHEVVGHYVINIIDAQSRGGDAKATAVMLKGFALLKEPEGKAVLDEVQANPAYANPPLRKQKLEALATIIGREGASVFEEGTKGAKQGNTFQSKVKAFINSFYEYIKSKLPTLKDKSIEDIGKMDNKEFIRAIIGDAFRGEIVADNETENTDDVMLSATKEAENITLTYNDKGQHLAPNGKPSNLTEQQAKIVRTEAFKNWFGDWENDPKNASKVVDENGEPLVVYHGSPSTDITQFDRNKSKTESSGLKEFGSWFTTNKKVAELYAKKILTDGVSGNAIYPVFLNLRTLPEFDGEGKEWYDARRNIKADVGYKTATGIDAIEALAGKNSAKPDARVDGIKLENVIEGDNIGSIYEGTSYLVFDDTPNQIKLADGTNTTFNPNTNDIRFSIESNSNTPISDKNKKVIEGLVQDIKEGKRTEQEVRDLINDNPKSWVDKFTPYLDLQLSQLNDIEYQKALAKYEEIKAIKSEKVRKNELLKIINDNFDTITETLIKNNKIKRIC